MTSIAVRLEACAKTFPDGTRALHPVDLEVRPGEKVAILGPSGCGKTTTLRIVAGLETPDAGGRVWFGDEDVTALPVEKRNVGMVFQNYALFPNMSVAENVAYGLKIRGLARGEREQRVIKMLDMMRIRELAERRIDQLSGGQRQRVALARALAVSPRVLLLDEPLTALDAKLRDSLRIEIDALLRGLDVLAIYVTHDQAEAMALGDRIIVMSQGRVAQTGTPREIYHHPANRFVAEFVGTLNRLPGTIAGDHVETPGGRLPWSRGGAGTVDVFFRPESVALANGDGYLAGTVTSHFFLGDRTRLVVDLGGGNPIIAETTARREFRNGEAVRLDVDPATLFTLS
jgi:putative spermidine/putrescine transport system ATP-binding protein